MNIHAQMVIPLVFQHRVSGVICIAVRQPKQFTNYDRDLMTSVGREIAVAIEMPASTAFSVKLPNS